MFWGFGARPCLIGGRSETGFSLFRGVLGATIVKPGFGELALSNRAGFINGLSPEPGTPQTHTLGLQIAQRRPYLYTLGPKVGMTYIHGGPGIGGFEKEQRYQDPIRLPECSCCVRVQFPLKPR